MEEQFKRIPIDDKLRYNGTLENPDIKIFVSHRIDLECEQIDNPCFVHVRCGATYDKREIISTFGDDTGKNISKKRMTLNEFTVQYWAWKNIRADYYGLCHYRRYLNFSEKNYEVDFFSNVIDTAITENSILKYGLDEQTIKKQVKNYDFICSNPVDVSTLPQGFSSVKEQFFKSTNYLYESDFITMEDIIREKSPEYFDSAQKYFYGKYAYFCNLFVMKKEIFYAYCEWLFPLLNELEKKIDMTMYNEQGLRTVAHLGERLFGVYITNLIDKHPELKYKTLQPVIFFEPKKIVTKITPSQNSVVTVLACNDYYVPYLATMLQSIVQNAKQNRKYEIYVFTTDISQENQNKLKKLVETDGRFAFSCVNVKSFAERQNFFVHTHISVETYYRFFILDLFKDTEKVLYLDCDMVVNDDIADLYDTELGDNYLAAAKDIDLAGCIKNDLNQAEYVRKDIGCIGADEYFQAGVLLFNLPEMRKKADMSYLLKVAVERNWNYMDQDILNHVYQRKSNILINHGTASWIGGKRTQAAWRFSKTHRSLCTTNILKRERIPKLSIMLGIKSRGMFRPVILRSISGNIQGRRCFMRRFSHD